MDNQFPPPTQPGQPYPPQGPQYQPMYVPVNNQGSGNGPKIALFIGLGCLVLFVLIPVIVIIILTVVGRQVDNVTVPNVFSNISNGLGN